VEPSNARVIFPREIRYATRRHGRVKIISMFPLFLPAHPATPDNATRRELDFFRSRSTPAHRGSSALRSVSISDNDAAESRLHWISGQMGVASEGERERKGGKGLKETKDSFRFRNHEMALKQMRF